MKLHCFAGFWTTRQTAEENASSSWFFSGGDKVNLVQPTKAIPSISAAVELMGESGQDVDFRNLMKSKTEQHSKYFKGLLGRSILSQPRSSCSTLQMADWVSSLSSKTCESSADTEIKVRCKGSAVKTSSRHRRQGVYEREILESEIDHNEGGFKSVRQLRDEYVAILMESSKPFKKELEKDENLLMPPQSDYCSSSGSGGSDEERDRSQHFNWHRKHKVTRCESSDSAMGQSDEDPQSTYQDFQETKDCSAASPRGSIDHSSVPSKTIIKAQTVLFPLDRKSSMDCASEDAEFDPNGSRRQSCFTDDGDDASRYRYWRTPSVVVSDYSDDIMGLTLEDIEYIRSHRKEPTSSPESSLHSSCSNLNYCGSTISSLDSDYVLRKPYRKSSNCSTCSTVSGDEEQGVAGDSSATETTLKPQAKCRKSSGWRKLRNIVQWTPFFQTYKKHRYPWVQLAGHQGNFKAGPDQGTILKKLCVKEEKCFQVLMTDVLRPYVPEYKGLVASDDGECEYIQLQDLLGDFISPCVMDCKIGVRTYLEEELAKAKEKPKLRKDMYEKMCQIDQNAPTEEEHRVKGVTKPRYMVWRETISSTATLGFRIEGIRNADGTSSKDFKTTKSKDQIIEAFDSFTDGFPHVVPKYIQRLKAIKATLEQSRFFQSHEVIGSSLLFVHDRYNANVWLIDFAKTIKLPNSVVISHNSKWKVGNHEDGYLIGISNLIKLFMAVLEHQPISVSPPLSLQAPTEMMTDVDKNNQKGNLDNS
ncbi:uncharacterized protein [Euwallacea similis]